MGKYLFDNLKCLSEFKNDKSTAIITDIDGTISEIAPAPEKALVTDSMKKELIKLKEKFGLLVIISGRSVYSAYKMVGVEGILYVGNHGLEYLFEGEYSVAEGVEKYLPALKQITGELKEELSDIPGILLEDKGICSSIHYRQCDEPEIARANIINSIKKCAESKNLQVAEGRKLVELKPPLGYDKGFIIHKIIEENDLKKIIYLGDDITDVDAFQKLKDLKNANEIQSATILVLSLEIPKYIKNSASFFVHDVREVLKFFRWLLY
jgi:trehalose 6-phosphate phosphatase